MGARLGIILTMAVIAMASRSEGTSYVEDVPFIPDTTLQYSDSIPPIAPQIRVEQVWRGHGAVRLEKGIIMHSPGSDRGSVTLVVSNADQHGLNGEEVGYLFHFVEGMLPKRLRILPQGAWKEHYGRYAWHSVAWNDGATWKQYPFSFRMYMTTVDRAGNQSAASNVVVVMDDGSNEAQFERVSNSVSVSSISKLEGNWYGKDETGAKAIVTIRGHRFKANSGDLTVDGFAQVWIDEDGRENIDVDTGLGDALSGPCELKDDKLRFWLSPPLAFTYYKHYNLKRQINR